MKRLIALVAAGVVVSASFVVSASATQDELPTVKVIMKKLHGGKKSHSAIVKAQLIAASPNWEALKKETEQYVKLSEALEKHEPKKGGKAEWDALTKEFATESKALHAAVEKEDKGAAQAAFKKLGASCKTCHDAHKGK